jgi:hypothetical protein
MGNKILSYLILSGVILDEGENNGVEGSRVVWLNGERPEILRLRKLESAKADSSLLRSE